MIELIHQLILGSPTAVEIIEDRKGDSHKDMGDIIARGLLVLTMGVLSSVLHAIYDGNIYLFYQWVPECIAMSTAYFVLLFDYGVNIAQRKVTERNNWWSHLNTKSWPDNWKPWIAIGWEWRMIVRVILFGLSVLWYA